ncbi:MAG: hypothetical protein GWP05_10370 [Anaerolineaceae bacterium]|nr:hypothetical protein [Anaerolineaceae bacterium]
MASTGSSQGTSQGTTYQLPLPSGENDSQGSSGRIADSLPENILIQNLLWFCRLRWLVVVIFVVIGTTDFFPQLLTRLGLQRPAVWPWVTGGILALYNLGFLWHARLLARRKTAHGAQTNLLCQIVLDLLVLTAVVHFVGSIETYISFAYLFHIVLACIFFSRVVSLLIATMASVLYAVCVLMEQWEIIPASGIYADPVLRDHMSRTPGLLFVSIASALGIWAVVRYLASHLARMVRQRDRELARTNQRLLAAQVERARHMLQTTHELKAPFAAIDANTQLLLNGHCGHLPDEAVEVLQRINTRSRRLAHEIQEMLQLANLHSRSDQVLPRVPLDLAQLLRWCMSQIQPLARERGVALDEDLQAVRVLAAEDHLKMFFMNLLSNAVIYSHRGGHVRVRSYTSVEGEPVVSIEDQGIGIAADKLPHIFDEYYRTNEAARHNKESSGLGLAIVRQVAQTHGIRVKVESRPQVGTKFEAHFSSAESISDSGELTKETQHGLSVDY